MLYLCACPARAVNNRPASRSTLACGEELIMTEVSPQSSMNRPLGIYFYRSIHDHRHPVQYQKGVEESRTAAIEYDK